MKEFLEQYLKNLTATARHEDAREESYYQHLDTLIRQYAARQNIKHIDITILPKKTAAGNPDFRIWDGLHHVTGYIEAKDPSVANLDYIEGTEQLERYITTFPNVIITNFYEFRLYRNGDRIAQVLIGRPVIARRLQTAPPVENVAQFEALLERFLAFTVPKVQTARSLALELAKRTRFLRDEVITVEMAENGSKGHKQMLGFYEAFKKYLIGALTEKQFADLYAQTITYGLFAARTRAPGAFSRRVAFDYIPHTIGILRDMFRFISLEEPPPALQMIVEDLAEILHLTDVNHILHEFDKTGKGQDPILHFYETFLATYDPEIRERRGVYYTPEPVVGYIVRAVHALLKSHFGLADGLASEEVKLLDPAGGTLTFIAAAMRLAAREFIGKYGEGGLHRWIRKHLLENFYAFELMMAPYSVGHLKVGLILAELGYQMTPDERFKLFLTNTLEMEAIEQIAIPGLSSLSEESYLAGKVKTEQPVLVIIGNPPYSGSSANINAWTERLLKQNVDGCESYYQVDGQPLGEKNPKWLQDDYVKFLRFAQWKIQQSGSGIVGMITNHSYLDNPTFRGMRQSLMKTFDEIYILDLHGNSLKKETTPAGDKDENVFDIRQGVAIALLIKHKEPHASRIYQADLYGRRETKYAWLDAQPEFSTENYTLLQPQSPYYLLVKRDTDKIQAYLNWKKINEIFPVNSVGIVTSRDEFVISFEARDLKHKIQQFRNPSQPDEILARTYPLKDKSNWQLNTARARVRELDNWEEYIQPILYRPFDPRFIFYHPALIERMRPEIMNHFLENNLGLITHKREELNVPWSHALVTSQITEHGVLSSKTTNYQFPLYLYNRQEKAKRGFAGYTMMIFEPEEKYHSRRPNINATILQKLNGTYASQILPETLLNYIYAVFYSQIYRANYAEFLKIDFPRVPFTASFELFQTTSQLGQKLVDLHLLKSSLLDPPVAKYRGSGENDRIEKIIYQAETGRIYLNPDKYFEGVTPAVWHYHIGGYQVLHKYLKDRQGRMLDDAPHFCRIITALSQTLEIQAKIDAIYPEIERELIEF
ncbi:N-6 DNA methylase [candidate division KSB1 bacterium]|nr:N-6 DNA methylase [candidate division KSB1 bacterium]